MFASVSFWSSRLAGGGDEDRGSPAGEIRGRSPLAPAMCDSVKLVIAPL